MDILWTLLIGFFIGLVARLLKPGPDPMGFILTIALGITGAFIASYVGQVFGWYTIGEPAGFIASVLGAMALLFVIDFFKKA